MSNAARLASAIAITTLALSAQPAAADLELEVDPLSHEVTVVNATAEQQAQVDWALDRYEAAGLPISTMTITFHSRSDGCGGYLGYYDQTLGTLDMCNWGQHYKITPASTLLHELAHAWSFEYMTTEDRAGFTEQRGLDSWDDDPSWWRMGQEQAAEIIAWGVGGDEFASPYLDENACTVLAGAFRQLTGLEPIDEPGTDCHPEPARVRGQRHVQWRTTPADYCEIGTTCAYCWRKATPALGCHLGRLPGAQPNATRYGSSDIRFR